MDTGHDDRPDGTRRGGWYWRYVAVARMSNWK